ncbi:MAG: FkbM family methyltransferase [Chloroflexi bacterium]|nr:FkbM family methyltransferase [Chloroflexota bacterium]
MRKYTYYFVSIIELLTGIREWWSVLLLFLGVSQLQVQAITLRGGGLKLNVRGKMDVWSVKEAFIDRLYEKHGTVLQDGWTILDIGAGIGEFTLCAAHGYPRSMVYAFEPFTESHTLLCQNIEQNQATNVRVSTEAVWSYTGTLALDLSNVEPLQLQTLSPEQVLPSNGHRNVACISLADVLSHLDGKQVDLMKLDCEGAEYPILLNAEDGTLERIRRIVMEYHDNVSQHTHRDLVDFLTGKGYRVRTSQNPVHAYLGYLYASRE